MIPIAGGTGQQARGRLQSALEIAFFVLVVLRQVLDGHAHTGRGQLLPELDGQIPPAAAAREPGQLEQTLGLEQRAMARQILERRAIAGLAFQSLSLVARAGEHVGAGARRVVMASMQRGRQHRERQQILAVVGTDRRQLIVATVTDPFEPGARRFGSRQVTDTRMPEQALLRGLQAAIGPARPEDATRDVQQIHMA